VKKLLVPFFTAGYPELQSTKKIISLLEEAGSDYIEIGLPHTDAIADGQVIQESSTKAIENGINIQILFEQISQLNSISISSKLVLFSYFNPLLAYGLEKSLADWKSVGGSCLLIPDLPIEESQIVLELAKQYDLRVIFLATLTSTEARLKKTVELNREFTYLVSVTGVTGARETKLSGKLKKIIQAIKIQEPEVPVVIGFGISNFTQVKEAISLGSDGVVIGSALVRLLKEKNFRESFQLIKSLRTALG